MSWNQYIDSVIGQTQDNQGGTHCDQVAIIGLNGACWTDSSSGAKHLQMSPDEMTNIANCFKRSDFTPMQAGGIRAGGVKYQYLRADDVTAVYGKKKNEGSITLQKTKTAIVIGHCPEGGQQGMLNKGVNVIAQYLEGLGM